MSEQKQSIEERTRIQWARRIWKNPELAKEHGTDGYDVWLKNINLTQPELAVLFGNTPTTIYRWKVQHNKEKARV